MYVHVVYYTIEMIRGPGLQSVIYVRLVIHTNEEILSSCVRFHTFQLWVY